MANNYVYILDGAAYVNLTNKCDNACTFCIRNSGDGVAGTPLWLDREPTADDVLTQFDDIEGELVSREVVFCGYGEPTENLEALKKCAKEFKARGYETRLNTNGLGSLSAGRDITDELNDIDTVSVSLNSSTAQKYYDVTRSRYGLKAFDAMIEFATGCKTKGIDTVFTVVDTIGKDDIEECKELCATLGIPLKIRKYISDNYSNKRG